MTTIPSSGSVTDVNVNTLIKQQEIKNVDNTNKTTEAKSNENANKAVEAKSNSEVIQKNENTIKEAENTVNQVKEMGNKTAAAGFSPTSSILPNFDVQSKPSDLKITEKNNIFNTLEDATKSASSYSGTVAVAKNDDGSFSLFKASKDQMDKITNEPNYSGKVQQFITKNDNGESMVKNITPQQSNSMPAMTSTVSVDAPSQGGSIPKAETSTTTPTDDKNLPAVMLDKLKGNEMRDIMNMISQNPKGFQDNLDKILADPKVSEPTKQFIRETSSSIKEVLDTAKNGGDIAAALNKVTTNGQSVGQSIQKAYISEEVYSKFSQEKGGWFSKSPASHLEGVVSDYDTQFKKLQASSSDGKVSGEKILNEMSKSGKESAAVSSINSSLKNQKEFNDINSKATNNNIAKTVKEYLLKNPNVVPTVDFSTPDALNAALATLVKPGQQLTKEEAGTLMNFKNALEGVKNNKFSQQEIKVFNDLIAMQSKLNLSPEQATALEKLKPLVTDYNTKVNKFQSDYKNLTEAFGKMNTSCDKLQSLISKARAEVDGLEGKPETKKIAIARLEFLEKLAGTASKIPQNNDIQKALYSAVLEKVLAKVESGTPSKEDWDSMSGLGKRLAHISSEMPKIIKSEVAANPNISNAELADKILASEDVQEILKGSSIKAENIKTLLEDGSYISDVKTSKDSVADSTQASSFDYFSDFSNIFSSMSLLPGFDFMSPLSGMMGMQSLLSNPIQTTDSGVNSDLTLRKPLSTPSTFGNTLKLSLNSDLATSGLGNIVSPTPSLLTTHSSPSTSPAVDVATADLGIASTNLDKAQEHITSAESTAANTITYKALENAKMPDPTSPSDVMTFSSLTKELNLNLSDIGKEMKLATFDQKAVTLSSDNILKSINQFSNFQALFSFASKVPNISGGDWQTKEVARIHALVEADAKTFERQREANRVEAEAIGKEVKRANDSADKIAQQEVVAPPLQNPLATEDPGDTIGDATQFVQGTSGDVSSSGQSNQAADLLRTLRGIIKKLDKELGAVKKEVLKKNKETQNILNTGFNDMLKYTHLDMEKVILNQSVTKSKNEMRTYSQDVEKFRKMLERNNLGQFSPALKGIENDLARLSKS